MPFLPLFQPNAYCPVPCFCHLKCLGEYSMSVLKELSHSLSQLFKYFIAEMYRNLFNHFLIGGH